jgi:hypothetical protein
MGARAWRLAFGPRATGRSADVLRQAIDAVRGGAVWS